MARLPAQLKPERLELLPDGTWLAYSPPSPPARRQTERLLVRVIDNPIDDPTRPAQAQPQPLLSTLLNPTAWPALGLMGRYHQRCQVQVPLNERIGQQRLLPRPRRSLNPGAVIQDLSALPLAHFGLPFGRHQADLAFALNPDCLTFVEPRRLMRAAIPASQLLHPARHDRRWPRLRPDMIRHSLPARPNPTQPPVLNRQMARFKLNPPDLRALPKPSQPSPDRLLVLPSLLPLLL